MSLSPDASHIAVIQPASGHGSIVSVIAVDQDGSAVKMISVGTNYRSRGLGQDGGDVIDWTGTDQTAAVLMTRSFVPEMRTGTLIAGPGEGLGVERVDPITLKRSLVEHGNSLAVEYITDGQGTVRITGLRPENALGEVKD